MIPKAIRTGVARTTLLGAPLLLASCPGEYELAPTFCDDWCRTTLSCDSSPSNCVQDCELTRASEDCMPRQEALLECYQQTDPTNFACFNIGFQGETRVLNRACEAERDALFECEAPGIGTCLALCRDSQMEQFDAITDPETGRLLPPSEIADARAGDECPLLDDSCESICWTVFSFTSAGLVAAGVDPTAPPDDVPDIPGIDTDGQTSSAICLQQVLLGCFLEFGPALPPELAEESSTSETQTDAADASSAAATLDELLEQCTE